MIGRISHTCRHLPCLRNREPVAPCRYFIERHGIQTAAQCKYETLTNKNTIEEVVFRVAANGLVQIIKHACGHQRRQFRTKNFRQRYAAKGHAEQQHNAGCDDPGQQTSRKPYFERLSALFLRLYRFHYRVRVFHREISYSVYKQVRIRIDTSLSDTIVEAQFYGGKVG